MKDIYLTGKCYYAQNVATPCTKFAKDFWSIDLLVDDDNRGEIEAAGLNIRNRDDERGDYITIKTNTVSYKGEPNEPPTVKDSQNDLLGDVPIGNGSLVIVKTTPFPYPDQGNGAGVTALLKAVQVVELVPYVAPPNNFPAVEGGYVSENLEEATF